MRHRVQPERVDRVRQFSRMYTKIVGALDEGLLDTPYSLTEARVLFEIAQRDSTEVTELRGTLALDPGYLSRMLARFAADGLVRRDRSTVDGRKQVVRLTVSGKRAFRDLDKRSAAMVRGMLERLPEPDQMRLVGAMDTIRDQLDARPRQSTVLLRAPKPGELGWVVQRHGTIYAAEYGWGAEYEALIARIIADYVEQHDPAGEAAWIAELDGEPVGSIFCVRKDEHTAKLRLLLVEPSARGHGVGTRLVDECVAFARVCGYRAIELWTVHVLHDARRIYQRAGFTVVKSEPHTGFGENLIGQTWRLKL